MRALRATAAVERGTKRHAQQASTRRRTANPASRVARATSIPPERQTARAPHVPLGAIQLVTPLGTRRATHAPRASAATVRGIKMHAEREFFLSAVCARRAAPRSCGRAVAVAWQTHSVRHVLMEATRAAQLPRTRRATHAQAGTLATDQGSKQVAERGCMRHLVAAFRAVLAISTPRGRQTLHAARATLEATRAATRPKTQPARHAPQVSAATVLGLKPSAALGKTPAAPVRLRVNYAPALVRPTRLVQRTARVQPAIPGATRAATRPQIRRARRVLRVAPVGVPGRGTLVTPASTRRVDLLRAHRAAATPNTVDSGRLCA